MDWQGALLAKVRAYAGLTALVGARSYWNEAPQGQPRPYVVLSIPSALRPQHLGGFDLPESVVQFSAFTNTVEQKFPIMEAIVAAVVPGGTSNGHVFQRGGVIIGPMDGPPGTDGTKTVPHGLVQIRLRHTPS